ncbi:MAG: UvrD-helicase domain-containing protein [Micrococcales bacterium]|nr:UvrD-helicase domain-containing protein [Micrococcales bacterium]
MSTVLPFDPLGPLPTGSVVLEASAGTGKTHTIASLVVRYVAEGAVRLPQMLLVTFGRKAASELGDRVRERLVATERALRDPDTTGTDEVAAWLARCDSAELDARRQRLADALADLDAATITTTHGFCERMLRALGIQADHDPDATLLPDVAALREEIVDDLYLRKYAHDPSPRLSVDQARKIARAAVSDHAAEIAPHAPPEGEAKDSTGLARAVRTELTARKRAARLVDYDDLLVLLAQALTDPVTGPAATARVRERYRVVMVDEFQDTDPVQWKILRTAFHQHATLVLIGDPKQAVYAFRGADVTTYLDAVSEVGDVRTLDRTWRTDAAVLDGLAPILGDAALGDPLIRVRPVTAVHTTRRVTGLPPVLLRRVPRDLLDAEPDREPKIDQVRDLLYADVTAQVVRVLREAQVTEGATTRQIRPDEIAVLARRREDVEAVHRTLGAAGVPAVSSVLGSVFASHAAQDWQVLLTALARPGVPGYEASVALTPFVGWDAHRLATATDADRDDLALRLRTWSRVLDGSGVAALVEAVGQTGLNQRLVALPDGLRRLTDVRHVAEMLHTATTGGRRGAGALLEWLGARRTETVDAYDDVRSRRLESDADAVRVMTIHAAKGLEFPVVLVPFLADRHHSTKEPTLSLHVDGRRVLDVGGVGGPDRADALERSHAEQAGEDLRLAYVALTRASSAVLVWWSPSSNARRAPLTRLLLGERDLDGQLPLELPPPSDRRVRERLATLAAQVPGALAVEVVSRPAAVSWSRPSAPRQDLAAATFDREIDTAWRRTSYSALTAAAHAEPGVRTTGQSVVSEGRGGVEDHSVLTDEPEVGRTDLPAPADPLEAGLRAVVSPLAGLPAGPAFGTFVHEVLERVDTRAGDLAGEIGAQVTRVGVTSLTDLDASEVAAALAPLYATGLGPLVDGRTLADVSPTDRLTELDFELPLAGGDAPRTPATVRDVAGLLRGHLRDDDPFAPYADRLVDGSVEVDQPLAGYLTGSIDAVLRVTSPDAPPRFVVVDYKTNRLGPPDEPLTCWHYRPQAMVEAMVEAHYPLQLLLYSTALHRYLRWRLPGYDPTVHLGGGLYLFVRGMAGPSTPVVDGTPCGVLGWRPPSALVTDLSDLLGGTR